MGDYTIDIYETDIGFDEDSRTFSSDDGSGSVYDEHGDFFFNSDED